LEQAQLFIIFKEFYMKVGETITFTREVNGSTGYGVYPVALENLGLVDITTDLPAAPRTGAPRQRHFTFIAVKAGKGKVQFAKFRPWELPKALYEDVLTVDIDAKTADTAEAAEAAPDAVNRVGAFTPFAKPDAAALDAFKKAFAHLTGVDYTPLLAASQVVSGTNYIFVANAQIVGINLLPSPVLARVYQSLKGDAEIVNITVLGNPQHSGSYLAFAPVRPEHQALLDTALKGFAGSGFTADYVSTQLVAGRNYRFAGTQTLATKDPVQYPVLFTVYQPLSGAPVLTGVEKVAGLV
jgi:hypothetical protein